MELDKEDKINKLENEVITLKTKQEILLERIKQIEFHFEQIKTIVEATKGSIIDFKAEQQKLAEEEIKNCLLADGNQANYEEGLL